MKEITKINEISHHRNGVTGEGFHVVKFTTKFGVDENNMIGIVFKKKSHIAVFDMDLLGKGEIRMFYNSWRGDVFESDLRQAIWEKGENENDNQG